MEIKNLNKKQLVRLSKYIDILSVTIGLSLDSVIEIKKRIDIAYNLSDAVNDAVNDDVNDDVNN